MEITKTLQTSMSLDNFWTSVDILINKPHVINKRLWGRKIVNKCFCTQDSTSGSPTKFPKLFSTDEIVLNAFGPILSDLGLQIADEPTSTNSNLIEIILMELLPKSYHEQHAFQLACLDRENVRVTVFNVTPEEINPTLCPEFTYSFKWCNNEVTLIAECDETSKSYHWLMSTVMPQFMRWGEESSNKKQTHETLSLVDHDRYYTKYNELKLKHGKEMVKIWPECTDPSKFVYEDVAIATYLLLLWEDERVQNGTERLQTFVDLGCGNGLLVYMLAMQGHCGVGIDVRKRQIWDMYPSNVILEERTVTPSDLHLFPQTDWLIGNHSDELTPWIPVVAARSSHTCNFFLLPCCAFNFDGTKYQRRNSAKSQYTEYLEHIKHLCDECGFQAENDRLKIPSTKRICIVGRGRTYPEEEHNNYCNKIQNLIETQSTTVQNSGDNSELWIKDFKPRDPIEKVRNCTKIEKSLIESIVDTTTEYLLEDCKTINNVMWSPGRSVEIRELVQLIASDKLKSLKSECGGLQTLLKNNHHIFKVQSGKVQLRHPKSVQEINNEIKLMNSKGKVVKIKQKSCWFYSNHPQGCPLSDNNCSFSHVKSPQIANCSHK